MSRINYLSQRLEKAIMMKFQNSTKVKALDLHQSLDSAIDDFQSSYDERVSKPAGRTRSNNQRKKGLLKPSHLFKMATLNCRTLNPPSARAELEKHLNEFDIPIACIQEHRYIHKESESDTVTHNLGLTTLFTTSAARNQQGASIHGIGIAIKSSLLPLLFTIKPVNDRIMIAVFKGNPKTFIISCYSPTNQADENEIVEFYETLSHTVQDIPPHAMLLIGGDFNAQIPGLFSYHDKCNRNGKYLRSFVEEHNLIVGNTTFQKAKNNLWTWRSPSGSLSQIDYCLYRKRWRNSVTNCQTYSSSNPIGSDHRIVTTTVRLSLRSPKQQTLKNLFWRAITTDSNLASEVDNLVTTQFEALPENEWSYTNFLTVCNKIGSDLLPKRPKTSTRSINAPSVVEARKATLRSSVRNIQRTQTYLRNTFDAEEDSRINSVLRKFESTSSLEHKNAWNLVKELSGKKGKSPIFIEAEDRMEAWKDHFQKLLNADSTINNTDPVIKVFEIFPEIKCGNFSQAEVNTALKQLKNGKSPGLDGLPAELWKLSKIRKILTKFCNNTYNGDRPDEWGLSGLNPIPKKGNLRLTDNYRGISLTQVASKIYNRLLLNRIRPVIDKVLSTNQNGFRPLRSTSSHILALRRVIEELANHEKEAVITFIDFRKAFDSIDRDRMFLILDAYGIPAEIVNAIKVMYTNTSAAVITPEGLTEMFTIKTGVLQGDPLAPFLFIICLDYALRQAIDITDGFTLKKRMSSRYPAEVLADLGYADDIALLEDTISEAQGLLLKVELACQSIGLYLNTDKTKYIHLNPSSPGQICSLDGTEIELVDDFKYLGSYTNTDNDMKSRIGQAWGAINSLDKVWKSTIKKHTKTKVFKATVESILLYGAESWALTRALKKKLDGNYTRMLRRAYNISWKSHPTNKSLYGNLPKISSVVRSRRLALAGHTFRHDEPAAKLLLWSPQIKRRVGRPKFTLKEQLLQDTELSVDELRVVMKDSVIWRNNFVKASLTPSGIG